MYGITLNSKKGNILDIPVMIVMLAVLAICVLIGFKILLAFNEEVQSNDMFSAEAKAQASYGTGWYDDFLNNSFFFVYIGLTLASVISAYFVDVNPVFFVIFMILMVLFVFTSAIISDVVIGIYGTPEFATISANFGTIQNFFAYLPVYVTISSALIIVSMVIRPKEAYR